MSHLEDHAENELKLAGLYDKDADYGGMVPRAVLALVHAHAAERHSGASHALVLSIFNQVINFKTLSPLTDDPAEWHQVNGSLWQNRRQGSCFSEDGGKTYHDIDAESPRAKVESKKRGT